MIEPGVRLIGDVRLGKDVSIAAPAEIMAKGSVIEIGDNCDIAAFVVLNVADSSDRCLGRSEEIQRAPITIGARTFIGSHVFIGGGVVIGNNCKVAAGTIIRKPLIAPPFSLIEMGSMVQPVVREGVYSA